VGRCLGGRHLATLANVPGGEYAGAGLLDPFPRSSCATEYPVGLLLGTCARLSIPTNHRADDDPQRNAKRPRDEDSQEWPLVGFWL
jgi:hypothetical protein